MKHFYSPHTGELIRTETPADWMGETEIEPPVFDAITQGAFFVHGVWAVVTATPNLEDVQKSLMDAVQIHLDQAAQAMGYDDIKSAATYADEDAVLKFQQEGQSLRAWRSLVWEHCNTLLASVQAGEREIPSESELIAGLPQRAAM